MAVNHIAAVETKTSRNGNAASVVACLAVTAGDSDQGFEPEYRHVARCADEAKAKDLAQRLVWQIVRRQAGETPGVLTVDKGGDVTFDRVPAGDQAADYR